MKRWTTAVEIREKQISNGIPFHIYLDDCLELYNLIILTAERRKAKGNLLLWFNDSGDCLVGSSEVEGVNNSIFGNVA